MRNKLSNQKTEIEKNNIPDWSTANDMCLNIIMKFDYSYYVEFSLIIKIYKEEIICL